MILLNTSYQKFLSHKITDSLPVFNLIQQVKRYTQGYLFSVNKKIHQPLLNNDEIIDLLLRIKSNNQTSRHKHDSAFRQIGDVRSIYRGHGMDYEESRHYQPGDDPRYMNWALTARTGQHYMKVFREERQPGVFIVVDRRHTMRFGTQQRLKVTQAARVAAIAAFSAQEQNFSVGGVILDNEMEWFKENQQKQAIFDFIHQSVRPALPLFDNQQRQEPEINNVLRILNEVLTTGSTIFLISDFYDIDESSQPILLQLSSSHKINAIQITDPAELKLPKAGSLSLRPSDSNKKVHVNSNSLLEQNKYKISSKGYFSKKRRLFENIAIPYQQVLTTDDAIEQKVIF
jgi:hypothetical protein